MVRKGTFSRVVMIISIAAFLFGIFDCAKKEDIIKIGVVLPLTGSGAAYGQDSQRGIELATEEINNQGGIKGKKIQLVMEDDQSVPKTSTLAVTKLINQDKVQVIIGSDLSSCVLADAPVAEKAKVVLLSPGASNPRITQAGDYIFRNWISDELEGSRMAEFMFNDMKLRNIAILYINNEYGVGLKEVVERRFKELGGNILLSESYEQDEMDFRTQLTKIKKLNPEGIYLPGYYKEMAHIVNQAKELGVKNQFYSCVCFEDPELLKIAGKNADGVIYSTPFYDPNSLEEHIRQFLKSFEEEFNREPGIFAGHGYDALKIVTLAIERGGYSGEAIKNELYKVRDFPGVSGNTSFDENGDVVKPVAIKTVKNGVFTMFK